MFVNEDQLIDSEKNTGDAVEDQKIDLLSEKESDGLSNGDFSVPDIDISEAINSLMGNIAQPGQSSNTGEISKSEPQKVKPDANTAAFAAEMYVSVLEDILDGGGEYIGGTQKKYSPGNKFMSGYKKITATAIEAGELTLPTPIQMFYIATLALLAITAFNAFQERKKTRKKTSEKKESENLQLKEATAAVIEQKTAPRRALPENEARRGKFKTEDGFYVFDLNGKYIPKGERFLQPSEKAEKLINQNLSSAEIKKQLQNG